MPRISVTNAGGPNVLAFLSTITRSEIDAWVLAHSDDGYNVLVGSHGPITKRDSKTGKTENIPARLLTFPTYATHPATYVRDVNSTGAGAYQLLARYYEPYRALLGLHDFSPEAQDRIAIQQIRECRALPLLQAGRFADAVAACAHIWASLTGSPYGQHTNPLALLQTYYASAGGVVAA